MAQPSDMSLAVRSQMIERSNIYPIKMAATIVCQIALLSGLVWMFH